MSTIFLDRDAKYYLVDARHKEHSPCLGKTKRKETEVFMRKQQHSLSGKLLTVFLIFLALSITIFMQHPRRVQGAASSTGIWKVYTIPIPVGYSKLIFDDEFNGTTLDTSKWITNAGRGGVCTSVDVGGIACFDPQAVSVSNGSAHIETNRQSINGYSYLAGIINTDTKYYFTYGYFDIRAKMPKGDGLWSGIWLYNTVGDANEIDIVELRGKDPRTAYQTFQGNNVGKTQFNTGGTDWSLAYHDYAVMWQPGLLIFYIDGIERGRVTTAVPSEKMYLMLDSDVGGSTAWSGSPDSSTPFPSYLDVEYVRVYQ